MCIFSHIFIVVINLCLYIGLSQFCGVFLFFPFFFLLPSFFFLFLIFKLKNFLNLVYFFYIYSFVCLSYCYFPLAVNLIYINLLYLPLCNFAYLCFLSFLSSQRISQFYFHCFIPHLAPCFRFIFQFVLS